MNAIYNFYVWLNEKDDIFDSKNQVVLFTF